MRFRVELIKEKLRFRSEIVVMWHLGLTPMEFKIVMNEQYEDKEKRMDIIISKASIMAHFLRINVCDLFE